MIALIIVYDCSEQSRAGGASVRTGRSDRRREARRAAAGGGQEAEVHKDGSAGRDASKVACRPAMVKWRTDETPAPGAAGTPGLGLHGAFHESSTARRSPAARPTPPDLARSCLHAP